MEVFFLDNEEFHLTVGEAQQVDEANAKYPVGPEGDKAFNDWFRDFLRKRHIAPVNRRLAQYWSGTKNSSDETVKMALTLRAMRSVVGVMDPDNNLTVEYATDDSGAAWDGRTKVTAPVQPVKDAADLYEAINAESGHVIHEACHSKQTRKINSIKMAKYRDENPINEILVNLLEDERIEPIEMEENPGFQTYLTQRDNRLWEKYGEEWFKQLPPFEKADYKAKISAAIVGSAFSEQINDRLSPEWQEFVKKVGSVVNPYVDRKTEVTDNIAIDTTEVLKQMMDITPEDEEDSKSEGKDDMDQMGEMMGHGKPDLDGEDTLDAETAQLIEDMVSQEIEDLKPNNPMFIPDGTEPPSAITVLRPKVSDPKQMPRIDGLLARAKAAFELRKAAPRADERFQTSGEVDEDELYRLMQGDMRVFRDIQEEVQPSAAVYFLMDLSGSMHGWFSGGGGWSRFDASVETTRLDVAQKMAFLLVKALQTKPNVTVRVLGHTGDTYEVDHNGNVSFSRPGAVFYRIWEEGDNLNRLSLIKTIHSGENYDSYAIGWAGNLLHTEETAEQKLLIVLSDGQPAGRRYGGRPAMLHVRKHVDALERKGIKVIQLSMSSSLSYTDQQRMFKHFIPAPGGKDPYGTILNNLKRLLERVGRSG